MYTYAKQHRVTSCCRKGQRVFKAHLSPRQLWTRAVLRRRLYFICQLHSSRFQQIATIGKAFGPVSVQTKVKFSSRVVEMSATQLSVRFPLCFNRLGQRYLSFALLFPLSKGPHLPLHFPISFLFPTSSRKTCARPGDRSATADKKSFDLL